MRKKTHKSTQMQGDLLFKYILYGGSSKVTGLVPGCVKADDPVGSSALVICRTEVLRGLKPAPRVLMSRAAAAKSGRATRGGDTKGASEAEEYSIFKDPVQLGKWSGVQGAFSTLCRRSRRELTIDST